MRRPLAALLAASLFVLPAAAEAASTPDRVGASASANSLGSDLKRALRGVGRLDLARVDTSGFTLKRVRALAAGKASFVATSRSGDTVARGSKSFSRPGRASVKMKLTRSGKKLLRGASRVTLTVKATFRSRAGGRISARSKVTLKRNPLPVPAAPIPANVTPLYGQTFDSRAPWSGLSTQCAHPVQWKTENGDGYAHFEVRPGEPTVAGHERCEVSYGGFGNSTPPGEYWYRARQRAGSGFPQAPGSDNWVNVLQWHEDKPAPGKDTGPVDAAVFVNSTPPERMLIEGDHIGYLQSLPFDIHAWNDFVVHGVWTDRPSGYIEWWINGVYGGRATGVTSETGGRHFWKGGIERADGINTLQSSDISNIEMYRAP